MIWNYWPISELQEYLEEFDESLITRLEIILTAVSGDDEYDPTQIYLPKNLVKIVEAFAPSDCFQNTTFVRKCLDRLPPEVLNDLAKALGINAAINDFEGKRDEIALAGWSNKKFVGKFLEFFGLSEHFKELPQENIPDEEDINPPSVDAPICITAPFKTLKDYQFEVCTQANRKLEIRLSRFIIQMPTGAGKTRTAMELVASFLNESNENIIIVWLAHSEELCEQAYQCFMEVWVHVARKKIKVCRSWGKHPIPPNYDLPMFIIGGFQKFFSVLKGSPIQLELLSSRVKLLVVDEAHKTVAPTYKAVLHALINMDTHVVGLTATPGRTIMEETVELASFYFSEIIYVKGNTGESIIEYLRNKQVLARTEFEELVSGQTYKLTPSQLKRIEQELDFPPGFLNMIGDDDVRNIEIIKRLIKECKHGRSVLFFSASVKHSRFMTALLMYLGYTAAHVDGNTNKARRAQVIGDFKSGNLQVLSNFGVLTTGFDAPNTDTVFIARPTNSVVLYSQMIGRGMRGVAIGGTEKCSIIDVRDNIEGYGDFRKVYHYFDEYWS